jgi:hypothetical protein
MGNPPVSGHSGSTPDATRMRDKPRYGFTDAKRHRRALARPADFAYYSVTGRVPKPENESE